jgi:hypothetical protein
MSRAQSSQISKTAAANSATDQGNANSLFSTLMPAYQSQLANPGYTPAQQTAITGASEGGIGAAFGSAAEGAANTAARTNNSAGLTSSMDALARQRMVASGQQGAQNQETFANNAQQQKEQALQGMQGLFGTTTGASGSQLGTAEQASAASPSFWDELGSSVAGGIGKTLIPSVNYSAGPVQGGYG